MDETDPRTPAEVPVSKMAELCGDAEKARRIWFLHESLREFGGMTAAMAVAMGRESDVPRLLEIYEAG